MTRVLQPSNPTQAPVLPGTQVVTQMPMATAVNAGDYVYQTASGYGVAAATGSAGAYTNLIGVTSVTGGLVTGSLPSFQYGPVQQAGTYSGTTYTVGATAVAQTQLAAANGSSYVPIVTTLTNNNFVYFYSDGTNYVFQIIDDTGATIAGPTAIDPVASFNTNYAFRLTSVYPTQDGGFLIAYTTYAAGATIRVKKYTSSGTLSATYNVSVSYTVYFYITIMELSNGNIAIIFCDNSYCYYGVWTSTFTVVSAVRYLSTDSNWYYTGGSTYSIAACPLTGGGFVAVWYAQNYGQWGVQYIDNSGVGYTNTPVNINSIMSSTTGYRAYSMCPTPDGNFAIANATSSNTLYISRCQRVSTSSYNFYQSTNSVSTGSSLSAGQYGPIIFPTQGNGLGAYYFNSTSYPYIVYTTSSTLTSTTLGTPIDITGSTVNVSGYGCMPSGGFLTNSKGKTAVVYVSSSPNYYPQRTILSSVAVTNGSLLYGTAFQPPNYLLQGVSATTVSAGQTATVVINGSAQLNSNYPSLASTTPFDFSGTGQFGNVGSVFGRTVTLKGVE